MNARWNKQKKISFLYKELYREWQGKGWANGDHVITLDNKKKKCLRNYIKFVI